MLLYIILVVVLVKLGFDHFLMREGMDLEMPSLNVKTCDYDVNIMFPYYDVAHNIYTDYNQYLYNNYRNILFFAGPEGECAP